MALCCGKRQIYLYCSQPLGKVMGHYYVIFHGSANPSGPDPPYCHSFTIVLLWMSDQVITETSTWPHTTHNRHPSTGGIRTRNPSKKEGADPRLRPRSNWNRHVTLDHVLLHVISESSFTSLSCHLFRCYITYAAGVLLTFMGLPIIHSVNKTSLSIACVEVKCNSTSDTIRCLSKHLEDAPTFVKWH